MTRISELEGDTEIQTNLGGKQIPWWSFLPSLAISKAFRFLLRTPIFRFQMLLLCTLDNFVGKILESPCGAEGGLPGKVLCCYIARVKMTTM